MFLAKKTCTLNEHFLFGKTIFDKVLKLKEGAIKPLQHKKILKT